jgi:glycosyltransferase involved in cell wall biosynthesis
MKYRLAVLTSHPIQYLAPLFRKMASYPELDITVYYCWGSAVGEKQLDPELGIILEWDVPLLNGYHYKFLQNLSARPSTNFWGQINPGIVTELWKNRYDAIIVHGYSNISCWLTFAAACITATPVLLRGVVEPFATRKRWKEGLKHLILTPLFRQMAAFLIEGPEQGKIFMKFGASQAKLFLIPPSVDNEYFQKVANDLKGKKETLKDTLHFPSDRPVILFLNKLIERKRPLDLLKAYEILSTNTKASLVFVGEGSERSRLEVYAREKKIRNVYFAGFINQSEVGKYYSAADVFVLPSENDASPKSLSEALNFRLPVIVSDGVGTLSQQVRHGENGFIYPRGDINRLVQSLSAVLKDQGTREKMGEVSLQIANNIGYDGYIEVLTQAMNYVRASKCKNIP